MRPSKKMVALALAIVVLMSYSLPILLVYGDLGGMLRDGFGARGGATNSNEVTNRAFARAFPEGLGEYDSDDPLGDYMTKNPTEEDWVEDSVTNYLMASNYNFGTPLKTVEKVASGSISVTPVNAHNAVVYQYDVLEYSITVMHDGRDPIEFTITDALPAGTRYIPDSGTSVGDASDDTRAILSSSIPLPNTNGGTLVWDCAAPGSDYNPTGPGDENIITVKFRVRVMNVAADFPQVTISDNVPVPNGTYGRIVNTAVIGYNTDGTVSSNSVTSYVKDRYEVDKDHEKVAGVEYPTNRLIYEDDTVEYSITFTNISGAVIDKVQGTDNIPAGLKVVPDSVNNTGLPSWITELRHNPDLPANGRGSIIWDFVNVPIDATFTITYRVTVDEFSGVNEKDIKNTAGFRHPDYSTDYDLVAESEFTANGRHTNLSIEKASDKTISGVVEGGTITYTITVANSGDVTVQKPARDVVIKDLLPASVSLNTSSVTTSLGTASGTANLVVVTIPTIAVNQTVTITYTATVLSDLSVLDATAVAALPSNNFNTTPVVTSASDYVIKNVAYVWSDVESGDVATIDPVSNTEFLSDNVEVGVLSVINATKTVSPISIITPVPRDTTLTYTITVTNTSSVPAYDIAVKDEIPTSLKNVVPGAYTGWTSGTYTPATRIFDLRLDKLEGGESLTYTFTTDTAILEGTISNVIYYDQDVEDGEDPETAAPPAVTNVESVTSITVDKTASVDTTLSPYDSINIASGVPRGTILTYTITVVNTGDVDYHNVVVTDQLDLTKVAIVDDSSTTSSNAGLLTWNVGTIPHTVEGKTVTLTYKVRVIILGNSDNPADNIISNTAVVSFDEDDDEDDDEDVIVSSNPLVNVTKTATNIREDTGNTVAANKNENVTYNLSAKNIGDIELRNVVITDTLPVGVIFVSATGGITPNANRELIWNIPVMAIDQEWTGTVVVKIDVVQSDSLMNVIVVEYDEGDTEDPNYPPSASAEVGVDSNILVDLTKIVEGRAAPINVTKGDTFTYVITLENKGNSAIEGIVITDVIPTTLRVIGTPVVVSDSQSGTISTAGTTGNTYKWTVPNLTVTGLGSKVEIKITVEVLTYEDFAVIKNTVTADHSDFEDPKEDDIDVISRRPILNIEKISTIYDPDDNIIDSDIAINGDRIRYKITVDTENSVVMSYNTIIRDLLPNSPHLRFDETSVIVTKNGSPLAVTMNTHEDSGDEILWWNVGNLIHADSEIPRAFDVIVIEFDVYVEYSGSRMLGFRNTSTSMFFAEIPTGSDPLSPLNFTNPLDQPYGPAVAENRIIGYEHNLLSEKIVLKNDGLENIDGQQVFFSDKLTYVINLSYDGRSSIDFTLIDAVPSGTALLDVISDIPCVVTDNTLYWDIHMDPGDEILVSFTVRVTATEGLIVNKGIIETEDDLPDHMKETNETENDANKKFEVTKNHTKISGIGSKDEYYEYDEIEYSIVVTNLSTDPIFNFLVTDDIPLGVTYKVSSLHCTSGTVKFDPLTVTWNIPLLGAKNSATLTFRVIVDRFEEISGVFEVKNVAYFKETGPDEDWDDEDFVEDIFEVIIRNTDVIIAKSVLEESAYEGDTLHYSVILNNRGDILRNKSAINLVVRADVPEFLRAIPNSFELPANAKLLSATSSYYEFEVPYLNISEEIRVNYQANIVDNLAEECGWNTSSDLTIQNISYLWENQDTNEPSQSSNIVNTSVLSLVEVTKFVDKTEDVFKGDDLKYSILVENTSSVPLYSLSVTDILSNDLLYVNSDSTSRNGNTLMWELLKLDGKSSKTLNVEAKVDSNSGSIINYATFESPIIESTKTNEVETDITPKTDVPLSILKTVDRIGASYYDVLTYEFTIKNLTDERLTDIIIVDRVPVGSTVVFNPALNVENNSVIWNIASLDSGDIINLSFQVRVVAEDGFVVNRAYADVIGYSRVNSNEVRTKITEVLVTPLTRTDPYIPDKYTPYTPYYPIIPVVEELVVEEIPIIEEIPPPPPPPIVNGRETTGLDGDDVPYSAPIVPPDPFIPHVPDPLPPEPSIIDSIVEIIDQVFEVIAPQTGYGHSISLILLYISLMCISACIIILYLRRRKTKTKTSR